jgi:vacuolar-type H+-ATPase subunit H
MQEDVIRQVKTAEDQAEEKIRQAKAQAEKILHDARHQAVEVRMEIVEKARHKAKQLYDRD